jgi:hypothetical protein
MARTQARQLVVRVDNEGYAFSLGKRKIYVALRDFAAARADMLRITDEAEEDYLYPKTLFHEIVLPPAVRRAVLAV